MSADRRLAEVVSAYARRARRDLGTDHAGIVSYAGLWMLLAALAPVARGERAEGLAETLGLDVEQAAAAADVLLSEPHPTVAAALGAWSRTDLGARLPLRLDVGPMPDQTALDAWAHDRTRGLVPTFPLEVRPETVLLLASALVLQPRWSRRLVEDDGWLVLDSGLQSVVATEAAGLVAVAVPPTDDAVDVVSVVADPDVPADRVWDAVDEVVAVLDAGGLRHGAAPEELADGHAWTVRVEEQLLFPDQQRLLVDGSPHPSRWTSWLPRWESTTRTELGRAPGVGDVVAALARVVPEAAGPWACVQSATASYDEEGFTAAAVTALGMTMGAPEPTPRTVREVRLSFDRPHAVVAVARGGSWEGMPLFSAWVDPAAQDVAG